MSGIGLGDRALDNLKVCPGFRNLRDLHWCYCWFRCYSQCRHMSSYEFSGLEKSSCGAVNYLVKMQSLPSPSTTFVSVDVINERSCGATLNRFSEVGTVIACQLRTSDRGGLSINSDSSSQSSVESLACSGPYNSLSAPRNVDSSHSTLYAWSS